MAVGADEEVVVAETEVTEVVELELVTISTEGEE